MTDQPNQTSNERSIQLASVGIARVKLSGTPVPLRDILEEIAPKGEEAKLAEFIDRQITVWAIDPFMGEFGPAAFVIFTDSDGGMYNTITGGKVLLPKFLAGMERLPFTCTIVKRKVGTPSEYYDAE
jgi:hypothetical protein